MRRIGALVTALVLVAVGLFLSRSLSGAQAWLFGVGLVGLVGIATDLFLERPYSEEERLPTHLLIVWSSPGLLVAAGLWLVQTVQADAVLPVTAASTLMAAGLLVALLSSVSGERRLQQRGRVVANLILYLAVFLLFALIYHTKERSLLTATGIGIVGFLAALELLRLPEESQALPWRMAALVGVLVAEITWPLNYWPVSGQVGGALLLLAFYLLIGLFQAVHEGDLDRRVLAEYGTVGVLGVLAITWAIP